MQNKTINPIKICTKIRIDSGFNLNLNSSQLAASKTAKIPIRIKLNKDHSLICVLDLV